MSSREEEQLDRISELLEQVAKELRVLVEERRRRLVAARPKLSAIEGGRADA